MLDSNMTSKIARAAGPLEGVTVLESGPGPGGWTRALLAAGARRVVRLATSRCQHKSLASARVNRHNLHTQQLPNGVGVSWLLAWQQPKVRPRHQPSQPPKQPNVHAMGSSASHNTVQPHAGCGLTETA